MELKLRFCDEKLDDKTLTTTQVTQTEGKHYDTGAPGLSQWLLSCTKLCSRNVNMRNSRLFASSLKETHCFALLWWYPNCWPQLSPVLVVIILVSPLPRAAVIFSDRATEPWHTHNYNQNISPSLFTVKVPRLIWTRYSHPQSREDIALLFIQIGFSESLSIDIGYDIFKGPVSDTVNTSQG